MKLIASLALLSLVCFALAAPAVAQGRGGAQERMVRDTYGKLELYNAAAQVFQNEMRIKSSFETQRLLYVKTKNFVKLE